MKKSLLGMVAMVASATFTAQGAGFALYGGSSKGMALGGAVMGKAQDASANFYNPATLSDLTNTVVTVGLGVEVPKANVTVDGPGGHYSGKMDPGVFLLPHAYVSQPLPYDFTFGLGMAPEFGLGTKYSGNWPMSWNTTETTVEGFVVNPNLAYSVTEDWSVAAGFRILYFSFEQKSKQMVPGAALPGYPGMPYDIYRVNNRIKGDNGFTDWGWQVSTRYKILDNLSAGLMYRSYIDTKVRGRSRTSAGNVPNPWGPGVSMQNTGDGAADIRLPQSISGGLDWDVTDTVHLMGGVTWTRWSSMEAINFQLPGGPKKVPLEWDDVFRFSFGAAWDFAENWTLMGSYVFDMDPCSTKKNTGSTMLPPGDRHLIAGGLAWHYGNWEISGSYGIILMDGEGQKYSDVLGREYKFESHRGLSHQAGLTLSYSF